MLYSKVLAVLALAMSAAALPSSEAVNQPFKLGVTFGSKTLYITETENATENIAQAAECTLTSGKLACGKNQGGFVTNDLHSTKAMIPTAGVTTKATLNEGTNVITVHGQDFSLMGASSKKLILQPCTFNHHPDGAMFLTGVAKAYYV